MMESSGSDCRTDLIDLPDRLINTRRPNWRQPGRDRLSPDVNDKTDRRRFISHFYCPQRLSLGHFGPERRRRPSSYCLKLPYAIRSQLRPQVRRRLLGTNETKITVRFRF